MVINDLQLPFEHPKALSFCVYLSNHYKIPNENVLNVGDETDSYWGGLWDKDPDAAVTANQEIQQSRDKIQEWGAHFPKMKLCISNHGTRWMRKAFAANIPSQLMMRYQDALQAPPGWLWQKNWKIPTKHPFMIEHGDDWGGQMPHKNAAIHNGMSTAMGHHHSLCGIEYVKTNGLDVWGMVGGCLINFESFAFEYARNAKFKPQLSVGIIANNGRMPILHPMD